MVMKNKYKIDGQTLIVYNRKDNKEILFDTEDFDLISKYTFHISDKYARTRTGTNLTLAHRLVMNAPSNLQVDHINGNRSDNRKSNLRIVNNQINQHNRHTAKGCYWHKQTKKWKSQIRVNNKRIFLGYYKTEAEARAAYLQAKKQYHPTAPIHG